MRVSGVTVGVQKKEQYTPGSQQDPNIKHGKRVKVSPRVTEEQYETLKDDELRDLLRVHQARFNVATEQLAKATKELKSWKEQTQLAEQHVETQEDSPSC